jgi:hypothetical protein
MAALPPGVTFELVTNPWPGREPAPDGSVPATLPGFRYTPGWYRDVMTAQRQYQLDALLAMRVQLPSARMIVTGI